ncbi:prepilin-type N-terminal cleavage/methylation domain-containing protein [Neiella sp. HB171785]|uniref:Prepilin-type N-terminal cleavage/methylation domain-containing protein n=1 Tax=Neiella litorisoli TaxID=2771431 RepID=A0A8J6QMS3_9GAMM|nr:prepilin-type N-terminal cleavage/methylation domain-containing protein [Neiella litorisoli]MBD1391091.1 prepilin-type N-terminal cleavage/methylation domain-containing protein [Neiella litorisoli]
MKQQQGFTLIELVVVIVILGILAVTAAPRFINLQGDARLSTVQGLKGAIDGANSLVYSRAAIDGTEGQDSSSVEVQGETVSTVYGYIEATEDDLVLATSIDANEWTIVEGTGTITFWPSSINDPVTNGSTCSVTYTEPTYADGDPPTGSLRYVLTVNTTDPADC